MRFLQICFQNSKEWSELGEWMCDEGELQWSAIIYNTTTYGFPLKCWAEVIINESPLLFCGKSAAYFNLFRVAGQSGVKYGTFHLLADPYALGPKWPSYGEILLYKCCSVSQLVSKHESVTRGSLSCCTAVTVNSSKKKTITYTHQWEKEQTLYTLPDLSSAPLRAAQRGFSTEQWVWEDLG